VTAAGNVSVLAGGASSSPQDGTGPAAGFGNLGGIAYDPVTKALYAVDGSLVRAISTAGAVKTLPGSLPGGFSQSITPVAYDGKRNRLVIALPSSNEIVGVSTSTGAVKTIAGQCLFFGAPSTGSCDSVERDGPGTVALFAQPSAVAVDAAGTIYVADAGNNSVRRIDVTNVVTTLAGNGIAAELDGAGLAAEFDAPAELALDAVHGILYTIDGYPNEYSVDTGTLRSVTTSGPAAPPPVTSIVLFDTATPDAQPFALDWRATTPASPVLWYTETTGRLAAVNMAGASSQIADP